MGRGLGCQVLAAAEADLEPEVVDGRAEERARIERAALRQGDPDRGQQMLEERGLPGAKRPAAAPAVDPALRRLGQGSLRQKARLRFGARSVFSQEKPPSASGGRPKWP
jgi:hypothetical protein